VNHLLHLAIAFVVHTLAAFPSWASLETGLYSVVMGDVDRFERGLEACTGRFPSGSSSRAYCVGRLPGTMTM
jgi:hypothetical protein